MNKRQNVLNEDGKVIAIKQGTKDGGVSITPVFDVRLNREQADVFTKQQNVAAGSEYIKPSYSVLGYSYNSPKK